MPVTYKCWLPWSKQKEDKQAQVISLAFQKFILAHFPPWWTPSQSPALSLFSLSVLTSSRFKKAHQNLSCSIPLDCHTTGSLPTGKAESVPPSSFPTASSFLGWAAPFSKLPAHAHLLRFPRGLHPGLLNCQHYPVHITTSSLRQGCLHSSPRFLSQHLVRQKHSLCSAVSEGCSCTKWDLGAWKEQDHPIHPFTPSPTELHWCWTNNLGIIIKHTLAKPLW